MFPGFDSHSFLSAILILALSLMFISILILILIMILKVILQDYKKKVICKPKCISHDLDF